ncbi:NmrA family protein [Flavisolibacter tropicus]|uniref:NmrA family protein n=2 Tax=Flavisolibacter tropicus TaxID=1492898 RepID=A0A172U1Y8_9BACT|nr:NmrA family protein [Flavisolibacter tropicus]
MPQTSKTATSAPGNPTIILAGATGDLGHRIANYLVKYGAVVKALVRKGSKSDRLPSLQQQKVKIISVDFNNPEQLKQACKGGTCLVSALNGLEDVMIDVQTQLLTAALEAGVPRFIPSDYCIDYTKLSYGSNRNLDLRKQFNERLDQAPISATSILNGMFTNLLTGQAPVILFGLKRVVYWGDADQLLDFTTMENTAEYTARAAIDYNTPRYLRIAGEVTNVRGLQQSAIKATGKEFRLLRAGSLNNLQSMISITRTLFPKKKEVFPPWQGMQYLHNMLSGKAKLLPLDNERYTGIHWTSVKEILVKSVS